MRLLGLLPVVSAVPEVATDFGMGKSAKRWQASMHEFKSPLPLVKNMIQGTEAVIYGMENERTANVARCRNTIARDVANLASLQENLDQAVGQEATSKKKKADNEKLHGEKSKEKAGRQASMDVEAAQCKSELAAQQKELKSLSTAIRLSGWLVGVFKDQVLDVSLLQKPDGDSTEKKALYDQMLNVLKAVMESGENAKNLQKAVALLESTPAATVWMPPPLGSIKEVSQNFALAVNQIVQTTRDEYSKALQLNAIKKLNCENEKKAHELAIANLELHCGGLAADIQQLAANIMDFEKTIVKQKATIAMTTAANAETVKGCAMWLDSGKYDEVLREHNLRLVALKQVFDKMREISGASAGKVKEEVGTAFVQLRHHAVRGSKREMSVSNHEMGASETLARSQAAFVLEEAARSTHAFALVQAASALRNEGPFDKVLEMIDGMVNKLEAAMRSDKSVKETCDADLAKAAAEVQKGLLALERKKERLASERQDLIGLKELTPELAANKEVAGKAKFDYQSGYEESKSALEEMKADAESMLEGIKQVMIMIDRIENDAEGDQKTAFKHLNDVMEEELGLAEKQSLGISSDLEILKAQHPESSVKYNKAFDAAKYAFDDNAESIQSRTESVASLNGEVVTLQADYTAAVEAEEEQNNYCKPAVLTHATITASRTESIAALRKAKDFLEKIDDASFVQVKMNTKFLS